MAGIYIPGMEMPETCGDCPLANGLCCELLPSVPAVWGEFTKAVRAKRRHRDCPIVSVPDHGRLKDTDAICKDGFGECYGCPYDSCVIEAAPTIIPADEEETE